MFDWTDESRAEAIQAYKDANPTAETSMDIVNKIAKDIGAQPNGVRAIISKDGSYIKKTAGTPSAGGTAASGTAKKSTRVNKADAQQALTNLIESFGKEADQDIIGKLTGKAALYLVDVFQPEEEDEAE